MIDYSEDLDEEESDDLEREEEGAAASNMATRAFQDSTQNFGSTATPTLGGTRRQTTGRRKMKKQTTIDEMNIAVAKACLNEKMAED